MDWIPIKTRPMTEEEKDYYKDYYTDGYITEIYDCELPEDGDEVIVTTSAGSVDIDIFVKTSFDGCYFETHCEERDVVAWMPLPEPYKE